MAKHKKTRKQKIMADSRRKSVVSTTPQTANNTPSSATPELKYSLSKDSFDNTAISKTVNKSVSSASKISTSEYKYLPSDLRKTVFLTGFVVVVELVIKFAGKI